ncbi:adenosine receptor A1-like [Lineus longissimus]|uniref:adenosine receptor A1-like n=1 Tax=Lineus longissimus TaxID=88925 RepID=UPI002B4F3348
MATTDLSSSELVTGSGEPDDKGTEDSIFMIPLTPSQPFLGDRVQGITDFQLGIIVAISVILFVVIVTGNIMVILAIFLYKKLQTVTNCFVSSLAFSDLLVGLFAPFLILSTTYPDCELFRSSYQCIVPFAGFTMLLHASISNLTAVTYDRFIAIAYPFAYQEFMTKKRAKCIIGVCWAIAVGIGFILPFLWNNVPLKEACTFKVILPLGYYVLTTLCVPLPQIVVIIALYVVIGRVAHEQATRIAESSCVIDCSEGDKKVMRAYKKERKATGTIAIIVLVFLLCWLPFITFLSVDLLSGRNDTSMVVGDDTNTVTGFVRVLLALLAIANSGANPIIYAFRLRNFRAAFWKLLARSRCCRLRRSQDLDFSRTTSESAAQRYNIKGSSPTNSAIFRCKSENKLISQIAPNDKLAVTCITQSNPNLNMFVVVQGCTGGAGVK